MFGIDPNVPRERRMVVAYLGRRKGSGGRMNRGVLNEDQLLTAVEEVITLKNEAIRVCMML